MIEMNLKPSWLLLGLLSIISIISCLILLMMPMQWQVRWLFILLILTTSAFYICRDALLLLPQSWQQLEVNSQGQLRLSNRQGQQFTPALDAASFIHPLLIILNFRQQSLGKWRFMNALPTVILFSSINRDRHRRLRVWLRWWAHNE